MIKVSIFLFVILFSIACAKPNGDTIYYFKKNFVGLWADTEWNYRFYPDGRFEMECKGHYDFNTYSGTYFIVDSIVYLNPHSDWQVRAGVMQTRLKITKSDCLRDINNYFYCTTIDDLNAHIEDEYEWQEKIILILDSIPSVIAKKKVIRINDDYGKAKISYNGIIVVTQNELHHFTLEKYSMEDSRRYMDFLVQKFPLSIYVHHHIRDSLTLIYNEERI